MQAKEDAPSEQNTIVLKLKVECRRLPNGAMENDKVYSRDLIVSAPCLERLLGLPRTEGRQHGAAGGGEGGGEGCHLGLPDNHQPSSCILDTAAAAVHRRAACHVPSPKSLSHCCLCLRAPFPPCCCSGCQRAARCRTRRPAALQAARKRWCQMACGPCTTTSSSPSCGQGRPSSWSATAPRVREARVRRLCLVRACPWAAAVRRMQYSPGRPLHSPRQQRGGPQPLVPVGVGDEHAKWSPVATTWYRLMPELALLQQPRGQIAEELAEQLPGLLQLSGCGENATVAVGDVRKHDKLLEKVRPAAASAVSFCWASLTNASCRQGPTLGGSSA